MLLLPFRPCSLLFDLGLSPQDGRLLVQLYNNSLLLGSVCLELLLPGPARRGVVFTMTLSCTGRLLTVCSERARMELPIETSST